MIQRISGVPGSWPALGLLALGPALATILSSSVVEAGMENVRFAMHYKPKFVYSKAIPNLCDDPSTPVEEPNYSPNDTNTPCGNYTVSAPLGAGHVYVVIGRAGPEGVSAASLGVTYGGSAGQGIDPAHVTWTPCANGSSFPSSDGIHGNFPQPGGGLRITWLVPEACQTEAIGSYGVHAVVGVFYVYAYSDDVLRLTPNYNVTGGPEAAVASCAGATTDLVDVWGLPIVLSELMGSVGFGNVMGCNPCWSDHLPCSVVPVSHTTWGHMKSRYQKEP